MSKQITMDYADYLALQEQCERLNKIIENNTGISKVIVTHTMFGGIIREHHYTKDMYLAEITAELNNLRDYKKLPWYKKVFN